MCNPGPPASSPNPPAPSPTPLLTNTSLLPQGAGFSGFLWDAGAGVELRDAASQDSSPGNGHGKPAGPSPYLARFKVPVPRHVKASFS